MSEIWYCAGPSWRKLRIEPIHVERSTDLSLLIDGRMRRKEGQYEKHFPTWDAAKAHLVWNADREVEHCRVALDRAISSLDVTRKMSPPAETEGKQPG